MAMSDEEKKELSELFSASILDGLKKYDSERAEWEANVNAQNGGQNNNGGKGNENNDDNKPAPSFAARLLGGSK